MDGGMGIFNRALQNKVAEQLEKMDLTMRDCTFKALQTFSVPSRFICRKSHFSLSRSDA